MHILFWVVLSPCRVFDLEQFAHHLLVVFVRFSANICCIFVLRTSSHKCLHALLANKCLSSTFFARLSYIHRSLFCNTLWLWFTNGSWLPKLKASHAWLPFFGVICLRSFRHGWLPFVPFFANLSLVAHLTISCQVDNLIHFAEFDSATFVRPSIWVSTLIKTWCIWISLVYGRSNCSLNVFMLSHLSAVLVDDVWLTHVVRCSPSRVLLSAGNFLHLNHALACDTTILSIWPIFLFNVEDVVV